MCVCVCIYKQGQIKKAYRSQRDMLDNIKKE